MNITDKKVAEAFINWTSLSFNNCSIILEQWKVILIIRWKIVAFRDIWDKIWLSLDLPIDRQNSTTFKRLNAILELMWLEERIVIKRTIRFLEKRNEPIGPWLTYVN